MMVGLKRGVRFLDNIIKIFKLINRYAREVINILVRLFLAAVYFVLFLPFAIFIKLFSDYLGIRESPHWKLHARVENVKEFLSKQ